MSTLTNFPLCWPAGWKRTAPQQRKAAVFGQREVSYKDGQRVLGWKKALSVAEAVTRLLDEVMRLGVRERGDIIISTNIKTRLDGLPYSNQAEPSDQGAAVYWRLPGDKQTKCMAIDRYDRVADNLAAVAATVEAMRAIERHGGAEILERAFLGFQALPPPIEWQKILGVEGRDVNLEVVEDAYRALAKEHHPDRAGGDVGKFQELNEAIQEARRFFLGITG